MSDKYCLVIPNGVFQNSADVFNILDSDSGGSKTFTVKLSNDGGTTLTHRAAYTTLEPAVHDALTNMNVPQFKAYVDEQAALKGRTPAGSVTAFKNSLQISEANAHPWNYVASIGLVRFTEPMPQQ